MHDSARCVNFFVWGASGDTSIQQANEKRFQERVQQLFKQFKEQRLTNAALECEQLINRGTQQLTEVCVYKCMFASSTNSAALQQKQMTVFLLCCVLVPLNVPHRINMAPDNHMPACS